MPFSTTNSNSHPFINSPSPSSPSQIAYSSIFLWFFLSPTIMQNQDMNLVLSTDAKPRLKWTPQLHHRFLKAVDQLGGADKATPKSLMRMMGITGLTLYHLKSHLQKYRLGKSQQSETTDPINLEEFKETLRNDEHLNGESQMNENLSISKALELQLEVQKKLHEQIEVQRHLQLRIEAQGKYLQSVLRKAQETIAEYGCSSVGLEQTKAELSQLVSMVNSGCQSSSLSELTDSGEMSFKDNVEKKEMGVGICSMESSLTSSESEESHKTNIDLSLSSGRKRRERSCISNGDCAEFISGKRLCRSMQRDQSDDQLGSQRMIDLNTSVLHQNDLDSDAAAVGLESNGIETQLIEYL